MAFKKSKSLDEQSPFVVDTHDLGRRAGAMKELSLVVPSPEGIDNSSLVLADGTSIDLKVQLESVMEGVWVSGSANLDLAGSCSRCLDPIAEELAVDVQEMYRYSDLVDADEDESDLSLVLDDRIDLEPALRDAVVLAMPIAPVCEDSCLGLCATCGVRMDSDPGHTHKQVDPRWEKLSKLKEEEQ